MTQNKQNQGSSTSCKYNSARYNKAECFNTDKETFLLEPDSEGKHNAFRTDHSEYDEICDAARAECQN